MTDEQGEPLFCLKDACAALMLDGKQVVRRLDKGVVSKHPLLTEGGMQQVTFVNEDGLYDVILDSRKREARAFRKWITSEVLPQIRKTGGYIPTRHVLTGERMTDGEVVEAANRIIARTIARANLPADDCLTATEVARLLEMGVSVLNHFLVDKGVQYWNGSRYKLTAKYADCGYAEERLFHYYALNGEKKQRPYLVWTPAGADFIKSMINS